MTNEEAITILAPETARAALYGYEGEKRIQRVEEACRLAVKALGKQIAKPPKEVEDEDDLCIRYECPSCGSFLAQTPKRKRYAPMRWPRHCDCGQKLEWSGK